MDTRITPKCFGLQNTGHICFMCAVLQALVSSPAFINVCLKNEEFLGNTRTGRCLRTFIKEIEKRARTGAGTVSDLHACYILNALMEDLRVAGQNKTFGYTMESASECLTLLLDILGSGNPAAENPVAALFQMKVRNTLWCEVCSRETLQSADRHADCKPGVISVKHDTLLIKSYFDHAAHRSEKDFVEGMMTQVVRLTDYTCERCAAKEETKKGATFQCSETRSVGPLIVTQFNQYNRHETHNYPLRMKIKGASGPLVYNAVATVDHAGGLNSGHYWTRGTRAVPRPSAGCSTAAYLLNDNGTPVQTDLEPDDTVYMVLYELER
jgi:uncharacterized UBP type Zn finger protein